MRDYALFINGIYEVVLDDIAKAQAADPGLLLYLQPYAGSAIAALRDSPPSKDDSVLLYASTTSDLERVHYTAEIVRWDDKTQLGPARRNLIERRLAQYQPTEDGLYDAAGDGDGTSINLLTVRNIVKIPEPFPVEHLIKVSDNQPHGKRTTAGGWSYVHPVSQPRA